MSHLWNIGDNVPEAIQEEEIEAVESPMFIKMINMIYSNSNLPQLSIDQDLVEYIEINTRSQRSSDMWQKLHIGRLTSSIFGDVLHAGPQPNSLVKQIVEGSNLNRYTVLPPAVQWGIEKEPQARKDYIDLQSSLSSQIGVEDTGLTLCATHAYLGASSDGRVVDGDNMGILEIKCPYSIQGATVTSLEVCEIVAMGHPNFCLEASSEGPRLKRSHKYYAQVQGELAIMGLPWCDFVVWTNAPKNNICVDRVYFDAEFVSSMMPKLIAFYVNHVAPKFYINV
ncbi:uncharacterized protein LOC117316887 [Pecten maximus]|uniref:uncharacterized protein LOC117316887 n=1 Tax=Pecten maximus TaxID=6579 RepID=UPI001458A298|nr:uncharacterized protein LOC117316887 [Pecten maximus]